MPVKFGSRFIEQFILPLDMTVVRSSSPKSYTATPFGIFYNTFDISVQWNAVSPSPVAVDREKYNLFSESRVQYEVYIYLAINFPLVQNIVPPLIK